MGSILTGFFKKKNVLEIYLDSELAMPLTKGYESDAGFDLRNLEEVTLMPNEFVRICTGICINVPPGTFGLIQIRSSISAAGFTCPSSVIDPGYTGIIYVGLRNNTHETKIIEANTKVAQIIFPIYHHISITKTVEKIPRKSDRGNRGFGSTGIF